MRISPAKIRARMNENGITSGDLCSALGIGIERVKRIELGRSDYLEKDLDAIADYLGVTPVLLMEPDEGETAPTPPPSADADPVVIDPAEVKRQKLRENAAKARAAKQKKNPTARSLVEQATAQGEDIQIQDSDGVLIVNYDHPRAIRVSCNLGHTETHVIIVLPTEYHTLHKPSKTKTQAND